MATATFSDVRLKWSFGPLICDEVVQDCSIRSSFTTIHFFHCRPYVVAGVELCFSFYQFWVTILDIEHAQPGESHE